MLLEQIALTPDSALLREWSSLYGFYFLLVVENTFFMLTQGSP